MLTESIFSKRCLTVSNKQNHFLFDPFQGDDEDAFEENDSGGFCSDGVLQDRITNVTASLEKLEVGIEESAVILALSHHFNRLEADR